MGTRKSCPHQPYEKQTFSERGDCGQRFAAAARSETHIKAGRIVLESVPKASFQRRGKQASMSILFQAKVNRCFAPNKYFPAQLRTLRNQRQSNYCILFWVRLCVKFPPRRLTRKNKQAAAAPTHNQNHPRVTIFRAKEHTDTRLIAICAVWINYGAISQAWKSAFKLKRKKLDE